MTAERDSTMADNRALWELVDELHKNAAAESEQANNKSWADWLRERYAGRATGYSDAATRLSAILERPVVVGGWVFYYADDEGSPHAAYCVSREDVYKEVACWMVGDPDGESLSDFGDDMIDGVVETLITEGAFHPEGDPPCFLRVALESMVRGKS